MSVKERRVGGGETQGGGLDSREWVCWGLGVLGMGRMTLTVIAEDDQRG